jgi:hypothetical protein
VQQQSGTDEVLRGAKKDDQTETERTIIEALEKRGLSQADGTFAIFRDIVQRGPDGRDWADYMGPIHKVDCDPKRLTASAHEAAVELDNIIADCSMGGFRYGERMSAEWFGDPVAYAWRRRGGWTRTIRLGRADPDRAMGTRWFIWRGEKDDDGGKKGWSKKDGKKGWGCGGTEAADRVCNSGECSEGREYERDVWRRSAEETDSLHGVWTHVAQRKKGPGVLAQGRGEVMAGVVARKPRRAPLTHKVREGLRELAAYADAGGPADLSIGTNANDEDELSPEDRKRWDAVLAAILWVNSLPD